MYLNYICQVDRLNSDADRNRSYILSVIELKCISSWENEQEWGRRLEGARHHAKIQSYPKSLECVARLGDDLSELTQHNLFDEDYGAIQLWLPDGPLGSLYATILSGKSGLVEIETLADMALKSEHLYTQFTVDVGFSVRADNPHFPMPVTFEMFCGGTRMYVPRMPDVGLVRKHVP